MPETEQISIIKNQITETNIQQKPLRIYVEKALQNYFIYLADEPTNNLYALVLAEVEVPLLEATLKKTKSNQTKAAKLLGISRGTLRKKLKQYNID